jgi:hypothetical protein
MTPRAATENGVPAGAKVEIGCVRSWGEYFVVAWPIDHDAGSFEAVTAGNAGDDLNGFRPIVIREISVGSPHSQIVALGRGIGAPGSNERMVILISIS